MEAFTRLIVILLVFVLALKVLYLFQTAEQSSPTIATEPS